MNKKGAEGSTSRKSSGPVSSCPLAGIVFGTNNAVNDGTVGSGGCHGASRNGQLIRLCANPKGEQG